MNYLTLNFSMLLIITSSSSPRRHCPDPSPMQVRRTSSKTSKPYMRSPPIPEPTPIYIRTVSPSPPQIVLDVGPPFPLPLMILSLRSLPPLYLRPKRPYSCASDAILSPCRTGTVLYRGYVPLCQGPYPTLIGILPRPLLLLLGCRSPWLPPFPPPSPYKSAKKRSSSTGHPQSIVFR